MQVIKTAIKSLCIRNIGGKYIALGLFNLSKLLNKAPYFKWKFLSSIKGLYLMTKLRLNGIKATHTTILKPEEIIVDRDPSLLIILMSERQIVG